MVFCGQCGYQLSPGEKTCPRCGAQTNVEQIEQDPGTYNPTEISHAIIENEPTRGAQSPRYSGTPSRPSQVNPQGPLILGPIAQNEQLANETTTMMSSQNYAPQASYPGYPQAGYSAVNYQTYQAYHAGQSAAIAEILESSRKGKVTSLLLILFGILLLIAAIIVFLLNEQGIIFPQ